MNKRDKLFKIAEMVGKAAAEKFDQITNEVKNVHEVIRQHATVQDQINEWTAEKVDRISDDVRALKDNKMYIKASRHSLDDMEEEEQQLVFCWMSKLLKVLEDERGLAISRNQRAFLLNLRKYIGLLDEAFEIKELSQLEKMGEGSTHQAIYKIFLALLYLHDNSLEPLNQIGDIDNMFKLSALTKQQEQELLLERVQTLGVEGLVATYDMDRPISSFTVHNVLVQHIELEDHPALAWNLDKEDLANYVRGFVLLALAAPEDEGEQLFSFSEGQKGFLAALAKRLGCQTVVFEMNELCKNLRNIDIRALQRILDEDEKKYTWLLDFLFLALCRHKLSVDDRFLASVLQTIGLSRNAPGMSEFLEAAFSLCEQREENLLGIACVLRKYTDGWKHIMAFQGLSLKKDFAENRKSLEELRREILSLTSIFIDVQSDANQLSMESVVRQYAQRGNFFKIINREKENVVSLIQERGAEICSQAITVVNLYTDVYCFVELQVKAQSLAEKLQQAHYSSSSGDDWSDAVFSGTGAAIKALDKLEELADSLSEQLMLFEDGHFISLAAAQHEERTAREQAELEALKANSIATLTKDNENISISIAWEDWGNEEDFPFMPADLYSGATDGRIWLLASKEGDIYVSHGGTWTAITEEIGISDYPAEIKFINNIWIIVTAGMLYFSADAKKWESVSLPVISSFDFPLLLFDGRQWILGITGIAKSFYYTSKGFLFDSQEEGRYYPWTFYRTSQLGDAWEEWNNANDLPEGITVKGNVALKDGVLVALFGLDASYSLSKNLDGNGTELRYLKGNKGWHAANLSWEWDLSFLKGNFYSWKKGFLLAYDTVYTSENGFTWKEVDVSSYEIRSENIWQGEYQETLILFNGINSFLLSHDGKNFTELKLGTGIWKILAVNGSSLLALWTKEENEIFLKKGVIQYYKEEA